MTIKPGEVYRVDLGVGGKVRMMLVVSRQDSNPPRALCLCVPITSAYRGSRYEVELPARPFLRTKSYANVQGLQAVQHHELEGPIGTFFGKPMDDLAKAEQKGLPVVIGIKHVITTVSPCHHVVGRPRVMEAQRSWHVSVYPDMRHRVSQNVSALDLTPSRPQPRDLTPSTNDIRHMRLLA
jgi:mRNA interferase MazF